MKKFALLIVMLITVLMITGCGNSDKLPTLPAAIDMTSIDEYVERSDVQYVDLRNFDEKMKNGYIRDFEVIPYFDYLAATDILKDSNGDWTLDEGEIMNQAALMDLFDSTKTIFLMCGSGTRAGYVKEALESLDYTVYNIGGYADYEGDFNVLGDGMYNVVVQLPLPSVVDMDNIDLYLGRNDVQYVDLRNWDDKMKSGYIEGFEMIPFFDYLEYEDILVRQDGDFTFDASDVVSQVAMFGLFDQDKAIFLMCGSGTRAGYVKAALESLGYTNVYNIGGIGDYTGENMVLGDDSYEINLDVKGDYTPGTYYGYDPVGMYMVTVVINAQGGIGGVYFDAIYGNDTKQNLGYDYGMKLYGGATYEWFEQADMLAAYIVQNQGWGDIVLTQETFDASWNALTVPHHVIEFDEANMPDSVAGVSVGAEGFVYAWNAAIGQASDNSLGEITTTITPAEWASAHGPAFPYNDGVFFGLDEDSGYNVKVTIENGFIVDIFFDAIYTHTVDAYCEVNGIRDDLQTEAECIDVDEVWVTVDETTTKQVLGEEYMLVSGFTWAEEADELAQAIIDYQEWRTEWTMIIDGSHEKFDQTVTEVQDDVAGVTIGVEGFYIAWLEAIGQATND